MMTINRVWITEKPDAARNLAAGLCRAFGVTSRRGDGFIEMSNGDVVLPLRGHMLSLSPPSAYAGGTSDHYALLPLLPPIGGFKIGPRVRSAKAGDASPMNASRAGKGEPDRQYVVARDVLRRAREIVNAGDVDREGQVIVDELLSHLGIDPLGADVPVHRLSLVSAREEDIAAQVLAGLEKNGDAKWVRRRLAGQSRAESDWLLGMNGSIAYQNATGIRQVSVGRVQIPVGYLVVQRDQARAAFKPQDYYVPVIVLTDGTEMRWSGREGAQGKAGFDEQGRIIDEAVARQIVQAIQSGMQGQVTAVRSEDRIERPPLPFSQGTLQVFAGRRLGMTVKDVTKTAESLYLKHKAISYVGTDCQFLPESMLADAQRIAHAVAKYYPKEASGSNMDLRSPAWNDARVDEHYAIAPNGRQLENPTADEKAVYGIIVRRFLAQFHPDHQYRSHRLEAAFGSDRFKAASKEIVVQGWRAVEGPAEVGDDEADGEEQVERVMQQDRQGSRG